MKEHPDFKEKYQENADAQNREIAFGKIFDEVIGKQRKTELDLFRLLSQDILAERNGKHFRFHLI